MLVLTRNLNQKIHIGDDIVITVVRIGHNVRLGIDAPTDLTILRDELYEEKIKCQTQQKQNVAIADGSERNQDQMQTTADGAYTQQD